MGRKKDRKIEREWIKYLGMIQKKSEREEKKEGN